MSHEDLLISNIANWYARKDILLTGVSGFMGKVLLEKLLRCCPNIRNIYAIVRPKRGVNPKDRIKCLITSPLFDTIRKYNPASFDKIIIIEGDIAKPKLGISDSDRDILMKNIAFVLHSAATVKFDEPLKYAVAMNVTGTQELLEMSYGMKRLEAFVYISTAYSNCNLSEIEEKVYPPPVDFDTLIYNLKTMNDDQLEEFKKTIIQDRPNIYSTTKALAEYVVSLHCGKLPLAIVRPSIVACSMDEPIKGWVDNLNGATGIIMSIGKGILRSLILDKKCISDIVPVDLSINMILAAAWGCGQQKVKKLTVYNYTSSGINPLTWGKFLKLTEKYFIKYSLNSAVWFPNTILTTNLLYHKLLIILLHTIPAYIIDFILIIINKKPRMIKTQQQINIVIYLMAFFTTHTWKFHTDNVVKLFKSLSDIDKRIFNFDLTCIDWELYMANYIKGIRFHVLKDHENTLREARNRMRKLKLLDQFTKIFIYSSIVFIIFYLIIF